MDFLHLHTYGYLFVWFIIYSFLGWVYESLWASFNERQWVNRGFLSGPVIPIYGFGAVFFVLLLSNISNPVYIFILGMVIASILEYFTSWAMEKLFHARWWDYNHYPFNLNGRICLYGALLFGFFAVVIIKVVQPYVAEFTSSFSDYSLYILSVILMILFLTDTILTVRKVLHLKERMQELQKAITLYRNQAEERIAEYKKYRHEQRQQLLLNMKAEFEDSKIYAVLKEKFGDLDSHEKRLLKAFPNLRSKEFDDAVIRIKNKLSEYKNRREKKDEVL